MRRAPERGERFGGWQLSMKRITLTRACELIHAAETLERLGYSAERILAQAQLPMWHYCDPDDLIPDHHIRLFLERAGRALGTANFGFLVGAETNLSTMGSFGRLITNSLTIFHAFATTSRLIQLQTTGGGYWLTDTGKEVWYHGSEFHCSKVGRREREQYALMRLIDHVRVGAGPSWLPTKIRLQTQEEPGRELREALGDPEIRIGQKTTAFAIPRPLLAKARRGIERPETTEALKIQLEHSAPAPSFVDALRQLVGTLLKYDGAPRIETMAEITGLSVRSLQRHLAKYGLTHFEIVDQARYQAATRLLEDTESRITDIGMELGYADSAHFSRAFKRWAGITPREYRSCQTMQ